MKIKVKDMVAGRDRILSAILKITNEYKLSGAEYFRIRKINN